MNDTRQQQAILRQSRAARATRRRFPEGKMIRSRAGMTGVVMRHVPTGNAQGGHLVVRWENGFRGRANPVSVEPVGDPRC